MLKDLLRRVRRPSAPDAGLKVRSFRPGDEPQIVDLCGQAYRGFGGHVPRTVELWKWNVLGRPGISAANVVVVEDDPDLLGYGAVQADGNVLELCVDTSLDDERYAAVMDLLVGSLEQRGQAAGAQTLTLSLSSPDDPALPTLRRAGYRQDEAESMTVAILDAPALVESILLARSRPDWIGREERILIRLKDGDCTWNPSPRIGIVWDARPQVVEAPADFGASCTIDTDLSSLTDLIFGRADVEALLGAGRASVEPEHARDRGSRFLSLLPVRSPWHVPTADIR